MFWMYQESKYAIVTQRALNKYNIVYIWQGSGFTTVSSPLRKRYKMDSWGGSEYSSGSEYTSILNMREFHKVLKKFCIQMLGRILIITLF